MEGYTNVIGTPYDFDDLDIEGRVVDEWSAEKEQKNSPNFQEKRLLDEKTILKERVVLDNGKEAEVFSVAKKNNEAWYTCHICSDTMVGLQSLRQHMDSIKHRSNMSKPFHPRTKFIKIDPKENMALEPGEPIPPGLEEPIVKPCVIQPKLDAHKSSPLIGLEFLVELTNCPLDEECVYFCLLCDKTGGERNIFIHLTSIFHYMKYLSIYFPSLARKLTSLPNKKVKKSFGLLVAEIVQDIENKYGRMRPISEVYADFYSPTLGRKAQLQSMVQTGPHVREKEGDTFEEKATAENVDKKAKELLNAPPQTTRTEIPGVRISADNSSSISSLFNKSNRVATDKNQLRPREKSNSPDVEFVGVEQAKSPGKKKRSRSRSLSSISSLSSSKSGSPSRSRSHRHGRNRSRDRSRHRWSRSRSRSPTRSRLYRRYSPSYRDRHRQQRMSPDRRWYRSRRDSRSRSPDRYYRERTDRYGRSREDNRGERLFDRSFPRETPRAISREPATPEEKIKWTKFREELAKIETVKLDVLKYHEKNPEQHPHYPEEWKSFWNRRYNELQKSGVDPSKHDFKPEWILFWTKRMKEIYEEELSKAKQELREKFNLPADPGEDSRNVMLPWKNNARKRHSSSPGLVDISPPTPDKKDVIADIKTTWKALTGSEIRDGPRRPLSPWEDDGNQPIRRTATQSPVNATDKLLEDMPQRKTKTSSLIFVLRKLTVLEQQLGSLAPKVFELLSQSLALEKIKEDASLDLLFDVENAVFLETVREKLIALLCAGVVPKFMVNTSRSAIKHIDISLYLSSKRERSLPANDLRSTMGFPPPYTNHLYPNPPVKSEPMVVPGVGQVDRVAIASQIAAALVEQGKMNVTEAELAQLVNAVVGMAEASAHSTQPMSTASFLQQLQSMQSMTTPTAPNPLPVARSDPMPPYFPEQARSAQPVESRPQLQGTLGALKLLQSAYNDSTKLEQDSPKQESPKLVPKTSTITDEELAAALAEFNSTPKDKQSDFIQNVKINNPEMFTRLRIFIPASVYENSDSKKDHQSQDLSKRSPITISISKQKSEQKIKPSSTSGRLSPFSSRSGGVNPAVGEQVVIDDDEDEKSGKIISRMDNKPRTSQEAKEVSKYKNVTDFDLECYNDDDDDDDDYSFEDVCKAAQEKLRQRQADKDSLLQKEMPANESGKKEATKLETNKSNNEEISKNTSLTSGIRCKEELDDENMSQQSYHSQGGSNTATPHLTESLPIKPIGPAITFKEEKPFVEPQQSFSTGGSQESYQEQYPSESAYPQANTDFFNKEERNYPQEAYTNPPRDPYNNSYPQESSYYPEVKPQYLGGPYGNDYQQASTYPEVNPPYNNPPRDPYQSSYRDNYSSSYNATSAAPSAYGGDQYRYRAPVQNEQPPQQPYPQARPPYQPGYPTYPAPTQRYPNSGYPQY